MNFAANLHPSRQHGVIAAGFSAVSHKLTTSQATMFICDITDSGVLISPASDVSSNRQYARFFMPTSMLNTLNAWVVVAVVVSNDGMSYIPSHEAIAGDGMNIGFAVCGLRLRFGCFYTCWGACVYVLLHREK